MERASSCQRFTNQGNIDNLFTLINIKNVILIQGKDGISNDTLYLKERLNNNVQSFNITLKGLKECINSIKHHQRDNSLKADRLERVEQMLRERKIRVNSNENSFLSVFTNQKNQSQLFNLNKSNIDRSTMSIQPILDDSNSSFMCQLMHKTVENIGMRDHNELKMKEISDKGIEETSNTAEMKDRGIKETPNVVEMKERGIKQTSNDVEMKKIFIKDTPNIVEMKERCIKETPNVVEMKVRGIKETSNFVEMTERSIKEASNVVEIKYNGVKETPPNIVKMIDRGFKDTQNVVKNIDKRTEHTQNTVEMKYRGIKERQNIAEMKDNKIRYIQNAHSKNIGVNDNLIFAQIMKYDGILEPDDDFEQNKVDQFKRKAKESIDQSLLKDQYYKQNEEYQIREALNENTFSNNNLIKQIEETVRCSVDDGGESDFIQNLVLQKNGHALPIEDRLYVKDLSREVD